MLSLSKQKMVAEVWVIELIMRKERESLSTFL